MESVNEGGGPVVINGGTVTATGNNYGIEAGDGSVTINGGTVTATGANGIYARCGITLGWSKPADSITASSFSSGDGVSVKVGQTFADERQNLYEGTLDTAALVAVRNKTLWPYMPTPSFMDPEGNVIEDPDVLDWIARYNAGQADIDALGTNDKFDELYLLNLDLTKTCVAELKITSIRIENGVAYLGVQLTRTENGTPVGTRRTNGTLKLLGSTDLATGSFSPLQPDTYDSHFEIGNTVGIDYELPVSNPPAFLMLVIE